jgi:predicted O-methyltransferase YrrM
LFSREFSGKLSRHFAEIEAMQNHSRQEFDVIVIDNHRLYRWRCAEVTVSRLSEGGMIILDNIVISV